MEEFVKESTELLPTACFNLRDWERLIGIMKQLLFRILGQTYLGYEELSTVMCDVESLMNTPPPDLSRKYQYIKCVQEDLRERFHIEYFGFLRQETRRLKTTIPFKVGDMVLIGQESLKPMHWPLARIIQLYPGKDGLERVAEVKTSPGDKIRPIQKLYNLEITPNIRCRNPLTERSTTQEVRLTPEEDPLVSQQLDEHPPPDLSRKYQYIKCVQEDLRERFHIEYFGFLRQETRRLKTTIPFKVGDMVLIGQESLKPMHWPLARIIQLYPGKDGLVRVAEVKTSPGDKIRPIQKLYNLEITPNIRCRNPLTERSTTQEVRLTPEEDPLVSHQEQHHIGIGNYIEKCEQREEESHTHGEILKVIKTGELYTLRSYLCSESEGKSPVCSSGRGMAESMVVKGVLLWRGDRSWADLVLGEVCGRFITVVGD
ncbi:hypothetical protein LAZ67_9000180 [Cordylochernes scorpioides]|uniref:DUF5641 domain-containing protein n=1 Tax=Cordylochernes scorpioides TaxID=51811 RepID=A0ABY6KVZ6_9ARAC|nr:hypothetical protein LAZ67_9000180 [Cordylochernes scorpioides]